METTNGHNGQQHKASPADLQWFFAKSKVSISLAITECSFFLNELKEAGMLCEEESLELQADMMSVHRCVYECLCCLEEKSFPLQPFFEHLFQKPFLKKYPDLKPIFKEYREGKYRNRAQVTADIDKDRIIFAQDKVKISLAITDLFPFVHGLQDLTILSEMESLECYLKLYPGLKEILQEPCEEQAELFTGWKYHPEYMQNFFQSSKTAICQAINERFPFLYGLHDMGLLSRLQLLKLQADKRPTKDVLYKALCLIEQKKNVEAFCAYVFCEFYINLFPDLKVILQGLNEALMLNPCPTPAGPLETPAHITKSMSKNRNGKPGMKQQGATNYTKPLSQKVSPASKTAFYRPSSGHPEKRPLTAGPAETQMKLKIYRCDYSGCKNVFSDVSKFQIHRNKHTSTAKVSI
ncbi:uncharacterized protein [Pyxicephalus adspersus]|uniref:uncharacterized protein isoform X2 n=1 Tax=Pyxicephalus adspersus TaxID=30357 RepID=UPI003B5AA4BB